MKTYESPNQVGKEANDVAVRLDRLSEELLTKAREAMRLGGREARRQIVRTALRLGRLLGEVRS